MSSNIRFQALKQTMERKPTKSFEVKAKMSELWGEMVFHTGAVMEYLPEEASEV